MTSAALTHRRELAEIAGCEPTGARLDPLATLPLRKEGTRL